MEMLKNLRCRLVPLALILPALMMAGCSQDAKELYQEARIMESTKAENGYSEQEILPVIVDDVFPVAFIPSEIHRLGFMADFFLDPAVAPS